jgi:hypothetical protein
MENQDDASLKKPQELDAGALFPEPTPIPTIDLSSLTQPQYTPEAIGQIPIPEIPSPPPIPTIDIESFSLVPVDTAKTAVESPSPAAPPGEAPPSAKEESAPPPVKKKGHKAARGQGGRPSAQEPLFWERLDWEQARKRKPSALEEPEWMPPAPPSPPRGHARRSVSVNKVSLVIFILIILLPMLCCCVERMQQ